MNKCKGKDYSDCMKCGKYYSNHSERYDIVYGKRISEVTCCIGGYKVFDEDGNLVNL